MYHSTYAVLHSSSTPVKRMRRKFRLKLTRKYMLNIFLNRFFPPIRQENDIENTILKKSMILSLKEESILLPIQPGSVKLRL